MTEQNLRKGEPKQNVTGKYLQEQQYGENTERSKETEENLGNISIQ